MSSNSAIFSRYFDSLESLLEADTDLRSRGPELCNAKQNFLSNHNFEEIVNFLVCLFWIFKTLSLCQVHALFLLAPRPRGFVIVFTSGARQLRFQNKQNKSQKIEERQEKFQ